MDFLIPQMAFHWANIVLSDIIFAKFPVLLSQFPRHSNQALHQGSYDIWMVWLQRCFSASVAPSMGMLPGCDTMNA